MTGTEGCIREEGLEEGLARRGEVVTQYGIEGLGQLDGAAGCDLDPDHHRTGGILGRVDMDGLAGGRRGRGTGFTPAGASGNRASRRSIRDGCRCPIFHTAPTAKASPAAMTSVE